MGKIKIAKAIRLTDDNIQEIWECPAVYRISKAELDDYKDNTDGYLGADAEKPQTLIHVSGFTLPCAAPGYLVQDCRGYWRFLSVDEYENLTNTDR